jgi:phage minor structural protein
MIEIYDKSNKNFDFNGDMVLKPSLCDLEVELNGMIEVTLEHPYDVDGRWKYIEEDNILRVPYPGKQEGQLFYIYDKDKDMTSVKCKARHIFFDLASEVLVDCRPTNCNGQEALNKILSGTRFTGHSNIVSINTAYYIRKHIANEALISNDENSFINIWGGELDVDNFNVYMNERTGGDYGVTFQYGRDLINLNENSNIDSIVTRIIPVGFNGITIPEIYVDSPLINKYRKIKTDVIKFDYIKVKEKEDDEEGYNNLEEAQQALRDACIEMFNEGIDKLLYQLELEVVKLEKTLKYETYKNILTTGLGDTVGVEHLDIGIDIKTRVIKFTFDCIAEKFKSITLGNYIENDIDKQNDIEATLDKITNSDGTVNAVEVAGVLNAINVKMRAMKDVAQKQDIRALLCEDLDPESETYGAMCYGTMGFMIASKRTQDNKDWDWRTFGTGKGFFADLIVAGTMLADRIRGGVLQSIDGSLELDLRETSKGIQFKKNGQKAIDMRGQIIEFFDWEGTTRTTPTGSIYSSRAANMVGLTIAAEENSRLSLSGKYGSNNQYLPYVVFDRNKTNNEENEITFYSTIGFGRDIKMFANTYTDGNRIYFNKRRTAYIGNVNSDSNDAIVFRGNNGFSFWTDNRAIFYKVVDQDKIWCDTDLTVAQTLRVNRDFVTSGSKNCVQTTENYGNRLFYATEDCESLLTDTGKGETSENGEIFTQKIKIDPIFKESTITDNYYVFLTKYGRGDIWIEEQTEDHFIVGSNNPIKFNWKVEAHRKGFENLRLEEFEGAK